MVVPPSASRRVASIEIRAAKRVGRGAAVHARMHRAGQGAHGDQDAPGAAQAGGHGRSAELDVAGVRDQHDVGGEQIGFGTHEGLESAGRHLLRALANNPYSHGPWPRQRPERAQQHHQVALAVGGAAAVPTPVALGELPRRGCPLPWIAGRLDVVVRVEEHRRRPGRSRRVAHDREAAVGSLDGVDAVHADLPEQAFHLGGRPRALLDRLDVRVRHRPHRDQSLEVLARLGHEVLHCRRRIRGSAVQVAVDRAGHRACSTYVGSIFHQVGQSWSNSGPQSSTRLGTPFSPRMPAAFHDSPTSSHAPEPEAKYT